METPAPSDWSISRSKRCFDFLIALLALFLMTIPMLLIAILVRLSSKGPALFIQERVGQKGKLFAIYKFRSMTAGNGAGPSHTRGGDRRITAFGRWLRKLKLDELPQFYNVLRGDMSLVGPRPKLLHHEYIPNMPYRPGITGAATLAFRHEEQLLSAIHDSEIDRYYDRHIKPLKAHLDSHYMSHATAWSDLRTLTATMLVCLVPVSVPKPLQRAEHPHAPEPQIEAVQ